MQKRKHNILWLTGVSHIMGNQNILPRFVSFTHSNHLIKMHLNSLLAYGSGYGGLLELPLYS